MGQESAYQYDEVENLKQKLDAMDQKIEERIGREGTLAHKVLDRCKGKSSVFSCHAKLDQIFSQHRSIS